MSTPAEKIAAEAGKMAKAAVSDVEKPSEESTAEIVTEDSDLGSDFQEMDDSYSNDFNTSDLPAKAVEEGEADSEEEPLPIKEEAAAEEEVKAEEEPIEGEGPQTVEEMQAQLLQSQTELNELRKQRLAELEETPEKAEVAASVSDEDFKAAHEEAQTALVEQYALSQEDADRFVTEPEAVLPNIAAKLHLDITYSVMQGIRNALPGWIEAVQVEKSRVNKEQGAVFEAFPALKEHTQAVDTMIEQYRKLNPSASPDEVAKKGGAMAMVALGLTPGPTKTPAAKPSRTAPHRPAAGTGRAGKPASRETNEFSLMADEEVQD